MANNDSSATNSGNVPPAGTPFLSSTNDVDDDDDDIEALAAKACALASVPVPDYTDAIIRSNEASKKKYGNRFTIDENEDLNDVQDKMEEDEEFSSSGIVLAERTSQILSNFQDYVSGISGEEGSGVSGSAKEILLEGGDVGGSGGVGHEGGGSNVSDMASKVRSDNKMRLLNDPTTSPVGRPRRRPSTGSVGSKGSSAGAGGLQREWSHDGYLSKPSPSSDSGRSNVNLHDPSNKSSIDWENDPEYGEFNATTVQRGQKYTLPLLKSRRIKLGVLNCLLISVIVLGISLGVSNKNKQKADELGDKVSELETEIANGDVDTDGINDPWNAEDVEAILNQGVNLDVPKEADHEDQSTSPEEGNQAEVLLELVDADIYQGAIFKYQPKLFGRDQGWLGTTYLDAYEFCTGTVLSEDGGTGQYAICPFEAICPLGTNTRPLGGFIESWVPISNTANDWVQVSQTDGCVKYSAMNEFAPDWGVKGDEGMAMVNHVMCCLSEDVINGVPSAMNTIDGAEGKFEGWAIGSGSMQKDDPNYEVYEVTAAKYLPLEFDRSKGWNGRTFIEALQFCGEMSGYEICPYAAICPMGPDTQPLGGVKDEIKGSWAPILDGANDWVHIGVENQCIKYSNQHGKPPSWSITGVGNEEITRHIFCCLLPGEEEHPDNENILPGFAGEIGSVSTTTADDVPNQEEEQITMSESEIYDAAISKYSPSKYNRENGWTGSTYDEARLYCEAIGSICPYAAICPLGPDTQPLGGYLNSDIDQTWMPVSDTENDWVQVGESNSCILFSGENPEPPEWGITSTPESEVFTSDLMCCSEESGEQEVENQEEEPFGFQMYEEVGEMYKPIFSSRDDGWLGKTYQEAMQFCGQVEEGHYLCPYNVICPMGPNSEPFGGYKGFEEEGTGKSEIDTGQWYPILGEGGNEWVKVSTPNPCVLYTHLSENEETPKWGMTGEGSEEITRHMICCEFVDFSGGTVNEQEDDVDTSVEAETETEASAADDFISVLENDVSKYTPILYTRESGWLGKTYLEAIQFCADSNADGDHQTICLFQAICPFGKNSQPFDGFNTDGIPGQAWVPISDESNQWVNLSDENPCMRYTDLYDATPDWGITGNGNEAITTQVLCCKGAVADAEVSFMYQEAAAKYHPVFYDRESDGYMGQTYIEAKEYCEKKREGLSLCPYDAYCPMADLDVPLGGVVADEPKGSWAPISDNSNGWVSIGPDNTCQIYEIVNGEPPEWGTTGEGNEEIARHVMCCESTPLDNGETVVSKVTPSPTPKPTPVEYTIVTAASNSPTSSSPTPQPTIKTTLPPTPPPTPPPTNKPVPTSSGSSSTSTAYQNAEKYNPIWYDRSSGWTGQTYDEGFEFCSSKGPNHDICPFEVICPDGPLSMPYGGSKNEPGGSWAPINTPFNSWVQVGDNQVCVRYENMNTEDHPSWGLTGMSNEVITRHILCCEMNNVVDGSGGANTETTAAMAYGDVMQRYTPKWYDRNEGWDGKTYADALTFCASKDSYIPCPYEAYCPLGEGSTPTGGYDGKEEAWAPIIDSPNGWVQIGSFEKNSIANECMKYNSLNDNPPLWGLLADDSTDRSPHIMCCREPVNHMIDGMEVLTAAVAETEFEQDILEELNPVWFSTKHGYHGTTHENAVEFCNNIGDMVLCPRTAYCPSNADTGPKKLFLQRDGFEGDQWAPAVSELGNNKEYWISIGQGSTMCSAHEATEDLLQPLPDWAEDGSQPTQKKKEHVLCCQNPKNLVKEQSLMNDLNPIWMDSSHGWNGGSHDDASLFCKTFGNRKLCPYSGYCPHGPGQDPIGGHAADFNTEGEMWAPVFGEQNHWVMIGQKYQNRATTCMDNTELEGDDPSWGLSSERAELKKYIACCSF